MASSYGWVITRDYFAEGEPGFASAVGTAGPRNITDEQENALETARKNSGGKMPGRGNLPDGMHWFRMYDDDGELYFEGILLGNDESEEEGFAPLDDYGTPDSGCTEIRYYTNGKWETL